MMSGKCPGEFIFDSLAVARFTSDEHDLFVCKLEGFGQPGDQVLIGFAVDRCGPDFEIDIMVNYFPKAIKRRTW